MAKFISEVEFELVSEGVIGVIEVRMLMDVMVDVSRGESVRAFVLVAGTALSWGGSVEGASFIEKVVDLSPTFHRRRFRPPLQTIYCT